MHFPPVIFRHLAVSSEMILRRLTSTRGTTNRSKRPKPCLSIGKMVEVLPKDDKLGRIAELVVRKKNILALVGIGISIGARIAIH